jgi:hypothetical protein
MQMHMKLIGTFERKVKAAWQSAKLFLQSSELGLPQPLTRGRVPPPPPPVLGGGAHSLAREGLGESQLGYVYITCSGPIEQNRIIYFFKLLEGIGLLGVRVSVFLAS